MNEEKKPYLGAKQIYLNESMILEIKRQMPIFKSKHFSTHVRKALRIGLDILKQKEAQLTPECTTDKESVQP
jgi:hypothetical protein